MNGSYDPYPDFLVHYTNPPALAGGCLVLRHPILRIQLPLANNRWTDREHILNLPAAEDYRLANFVYDTSNGRYHIAYGNKNADYLRATYPTTNPPVHDLSKAVPFPAGAGHNLVYAFSDDLNTWGTSQSFLIKNLLVLTYKLVP